jgi:hypothetical protein
MPIQIQISDSDVTGYSQQARDKLRAVIESYIHDLVKEIKLTEERHHRTSSGKPDVSIGMVEEAMITLRPTYGGGKPGWRTKTIRSLAAALPYVVGLVWGSPWTVNPSGQLIYLGMAVVAVYFVFLSILKE